MRGLVKAKVVFGGVLVLAIVKGLEWAYLSVLDILRQIGLWPIF